MKRSRKKSKNEKAFTMRGQNCGKLCRYYINITKISTAFSYLSMALVKLLSGYTGMCTHVHTQTHTHYTFWLVPSAI